MVAEREPARVQGLLEVEAPHARLDVHGELHLVYGEDAVEAAQVERDLAGVWGHGPHHPAEAAEGDHARTRPEQAGDLLVGRRPAHFDFGRRRARAPADDAARPQVMDRLHIADQRPASQPVSSGTPKPISPPSSQPPRTAPAARRFSKATRPSAAKGRRRSSGTSPAWEAGPGSGYSRRGNPPLPAPRSPPPHAPPPPRRPRGRPRLPPRA